MQFIHATLEQYVHRSQTWWKYFARLRLQSVSESLNVSRPTKDRASEKHWVRCSFYSTSDYFFLLIADAWVLKRAAVLLCISLPANCATLSSLVFKSVWSVWEHFTVRDHFMDKQTHYPSHMVGLRSVGTDPYFFRLLSFLMLFFSLRAHTETIAGISQCKRTESIKFNSNMGCCFPSPALPKLLLADVQFIMFSCIMYISKSSCFASSCHVLLLYI